MLSGTQSVGKHIAIGLQFCGKALLLQGFYSFNYINLISQKKKFVLKENNLKEKSHCLLIQCYQAPGFFFSFFLVFDYVANLLKNPFGIPQNTVHVPHLLCGEAYILLLKVAVTKLVFNAEVKTYSSFMFLGKTLLFIKNYYKI